MKTKLKIFFFEECHDGTVGGSHRSMYNLIRNMDFAKYQFTVGFFEYNRYVPLYEKLGIDVLVFKRQPIIDGNAIYRKAKNWYECSYKFSKMLRSYLIEENYDLVVMNNSIGVSGQFIKACRVCKIPIISFERGYGKYTKLHVKHSKWVSASIPVSEFIHENMLQDGIKTPIIKTIYNGVDPEEFFRASNAAQTRAKLKIPAGCSVCGIVGNVRPWKGQIYFVEAMKKLNDEYDNVYGLIVGAISDEDKPYYRNLEAKIHEYGLQRKVFALGYQSNINEIMSALDILVHASIKPEPFGRVLIESMMTKIPIVATDFGGPLEILNGGEYGRLVPPADSDAIATACRHYLENPGLTNEIVRKAHERANSFFHIKNTAAQTSKLIDAVCGLG